MAYYLKKTKLKGRTYLSIDESFYSHEKRGTAHKCFKSLGSVETWMEKGIPDPIAHFQKEVDALNQEKADAGIQKISEVSPVRYLGYFPLKALLDKMKIKKYVDYFKLTNDFTYDLYELLSSLIFARAVQPCSKYRTFHEVLPSLYNPPGYWMGWLFWEMIMKNLLKYLRSRQTPCSNWILPNLILTAPTSISKLTGRMISGGKGPVKKTKKTPSSGLGYCWTATRSRSV